MDQSHETNIGHQVITELTRGLQSLSTSIQNLLVEHREDSIQLAALKVEIVQLRERLDSLAQLVREGNGRDPLTTRLALVEASLADLQKKCLLAQKESQSRDRQKAVGRWQVLVAVVTGVFGLVTALIALVK